MGYRLWVIGYGLHKAKSIEHGAKGRRDGTLGF
jgi:hypothetical protein